jgi:hypothetical protein
MKYFLRFTLVLSVLVFLATVGEVVFGPQNLAVIELEKSSVSVPVAASKGSDVEVEFVLF